MQGPLDAGAVVLAELPHPRHHVFQIFTTHVFVGQEFEGPRKARFRIATQIENNLHQLRQALT